MLDRTQNDVMKNWPKEWDNPVVSIRCLAYNHEPYIRKALDGFIMQETDFPFEIIVHDDASTDKTAEIIREYEARFPKIIKPIYETENQFSKCDGSLRRIVNKACSGKYIAYCEGDDYWCNPHKLQKQYEAMETHPSCSLCVHTVQCVSNEGMYINRQHPSKNLFKTNLIEQDEFAQTLIADHCYPFQTSSYFLRKEILEKNEKFFQESPSNGDEKILRACLNDGNVFFIRLTMSCYRIQSIGSWNSRIRNNKELRLKGYSDMIKMEEYFDAYSHYKFHKYIEISIKKIQFYIFIVKRKFKDLFLPGNRKFTKLFFPKRKVLAYYICSKMPCFLLNILFTIRSHIKFF